MRARVDRVCRRRRAALAVNVWLAEHGLELVLAILGGLWFASKFLVSVGEWKRGLEPATVAKQLREEATRQAAHAARDLILADLQRMVQRFEIRMDEANAKQSDQWSRVQAKIGKMEIEIAVLQTQVNERP